MKNTRRMRRMARAERNKVAGLSLTSLMDVFTILLFFLLNNQASSVTVDVPKEIKLPDSIVEAKPRQTVVVLISDQSVLVQGELVGSIADVMATTEENFAPVQERLARIKESVIGINTQAVADSDEVTILADKTVPFKVMKKLMTTCTSAGYTKISLAVNQKASQG